MIWGTLIAHELLKKAIENDEKLFQRCQTTMKQKEKTQQERILNILIIIHFRYEMCRETKKEISKSNSDSTEI
jgi:hypothetical protein